MMFNGCGWGGMWWSWLFGLLLIVGLVVLVVFAVRASGSGRGDAVADDRSAGMRAAEILGDRYARGDLTTEEYQEKLRVLRGDR